jgi:hypothetical protein
LTDSSAHFRGSYLYQVTGNPKFADRVERITYNALPAEMTGDMWSRQYLQQQNQIASQNMNPYVPLSWRPSALTELWSYIGIRSRTMGERSSDSELASRFKHHQFSSYSNVFGLEPNYVSAILAADT